MLHRIEVGPKRSHKLSRGASSLVLHAAATLISGRRDRTTADC